MLTNKIDTMKQYTRSVYALLFLLLLLSGCSENVSLTGKVSFSDDKTPLTKGTVIFENDQFVAKGDVSADGTYVVGSYSQKDGIPKGTYQVYVTGTSVESFVDGRDGQPVRVITYMVDPKFESPSRSGLVVDVDKKTVYDFSVDRYKN